MTITNSSVVALTTGDRFRLFNAAAYDGTFSSFNLPDLSIGLFWSTTRLAVDGTLAVVNTNPPAISSVALMGGNLVLQGTNRTPNWYYTIFSSSDPTLPSSQWTAMATNLFDASGCFNWTNAAGTAGPQQFYLIKAQ